MLQKDLLEQPGVFQYLFENHPDGICIVDVNDKLLNVNASALHIFGYTREELLQTSLGQLLGWPYVTHSYNDVNDKARCETAIQHKNGFLIYVRLTCIPILNDGQKVGCFITVEDITQQRKQIRELSDIQEMFTFISEKSQNIISSFSADGVFTYISPNVRALLGYTPEEVIGIPAEAFNHPSDNEKLQDTRNTSYIDQDTVRFTGRVRHKNGEYRWYETTVECIRNLSGEIIQKICVGRDITDRKEAEETIAHLAYHDPLTDLPNRRLFKEHVNQLLEEAGHELHCLLLIDLDGFKYVNDTFGHDIGDLLLIEVAKRLSHVIEDKGLVSRWGGDEFTVIYRTINKSDLTSLIDRIKDIFSEPMILAGNRLFISPSIVSHFSSKMETQSRSL